MNKNIDDNYFNNQSFGEDEIDLKNIFNLLIRNKFLIIYFVLSFFGFSCIYALLQKRVWEGQFQIVLNLEEKNQIASAFGTIPNQILDLADNIRGSSLNTEVGILESPSILMPIFEIIKNEKKESQPNLNFQNWKKNYLKVELKKGTSILNISYQDTDKEIIIPVLEKMTNVYQKYSSKKRRRGIELSKNFVIKKIDEYKEKSFKTLRAAQDYSIDQDLTMFNYQSESDNFSFLGKDLISMGNSSFGDFNNSSYFGESIGIEVARVNAVNKIKQIDVQIKKIEEMEDDNENLEYITQLVPTFQNSLLPKNLIELDLEIIELESRYNDNFDLLKSKKEIRKILIKEIKKKVIGKLKAEKISLESIRESATRPKDVLLQYKELIREAKRDESTLIALENGLRTIQLEESKIKDPWQLITTPTLKDQPVAPKRKSIAFIGSIFGFFAGLLAAFVKEKKSGLIFEDKEIEKLLKTKIIEKIRLIEINSNIKKKLIINELISFNAKKKIKFILCQNIDKDLLKNIKKTISNKADEFYYLDDLENLNDSDIFILISMLPVQNNKYLLEINKKLNVYGNKLSGVILINN